MDSFEQLRHYDDALQQLLEQAEELGLHGKSRERIQCLLHALDCGNVSLTCERYGISRQTFYAWIKKFNPEDPYSLDDRPSIPKTVRQRNTADEVVEIIRASRQELKTKEQISVLLAEKGIELSASTVGRIVREHGFFFGNSPSNIRKRSHGELPETHSTLAITALQERTILCVRNVLHVRTAGSDVLGLGAMIILVCTIATTLIGGGLAYPASAHAAEGSAYRMYDDYDPYSNKNPLDGSSYKATEAGTTDIGNSMQGSIFQIQDAPPAAASSSPSSVSSSATSAGSSEAGSTGGAASTIGGTGGGRRSLPSQHSSSIGIKDPEQLHPADTEPGASSASSVATPESVQIPVQGNVIGASSASAVSTQHHPAFFDAIGVLQWMIVDPFNRGIDALCSGITKTQFLLWVLIAFLCGLAIGLWFGATAQREQRTHARRSSKQRATQQFAVRRWVGRLLIWFALAVMLFAVSLQYVPRVFSATTTPLTHTYHGHLLDIAGDPVTTAHTIRFSYWSSSDFISSDLTAGAINTGAANYASWSEEQTVTPDSRGYFSVQLGSVTPLPAMSALSAATLQSLYLQVEVKVSGAADTTYDLLDTNASSATADRAPVLSVPFAANADMLDQRDVGTGSGSIPLLQSGGFLPFSTIPSGTNRATFTLDADGATATGSLFFGGTLAEYLQFNNTASRFEFSDDVYVPGDLTVTGTASGSHVHAQQTLTSSGTLIVEGPVKFGSTLELNGITYTFPFSDGAGSGHVLMTNGAGQLSWGLIGTGALQTRTRTLAVPTDTAAITTDGTSNDANVFLSSETGATVNPHQYYRVATGSGQLQDVDIRLKVLLPADFVSFANPEDLRFWYRNTGSANTQSKLDILVEDIDGDDAFPAVDGQTLFSTSWTQYSDEFDGGAFNPVAGQYIYITIKGYASSSGSAFAGEIILTYTSR